MQHSLRSHWAPQQQEERPRNFQKRKITSMMHLQMICTQKLCIYRTIKNAHQSRGMETAGVMVMDYDRLCTQLFNIPHPENLLQSAINQENSYRSMHPYELAKKKKNPHTLGIIWKDFRISLIYVFKKQGNQSEVL